VNRPVDSHLIGGPDPIDDDQGGTVERNAGITTDAHASTRSDAAARRLDRDTGSPALKQVGEGLDRREIELVRRDVDDRVSDLAQPLFLARGGHDHALEHDGRLDQLEVDRSGLIRHDGDRLARPAITDERGTKLPLAGRDVDQHVPALLVRERTLVRPDHRDLNARKGLHRRTIDDESRNRTSFLRRGPARHHREYDGDKCEQITRSHSRYPPVAYFGLFCFTSDFGERMDGAKAGGLSSSEARIGQAPAGEDGRIGSRSIHAFRERVSNFEIEDWVETRPVK
jgi:hypothetical protein